MMLYIVGGILAVFWLASACYQVKPWQKTIQKFDPLGILPNYSFFAPKPMTNDYRLAYKVISDLDTHEGEWIELPMYRNFNPIRLLWSPFKYYNKGMIDMCNFLLQEFQALEEKRFIQVSFSYIGILSAISKHLKLKEKDDTTIRFAILSAEEGDEPIAIKQVIFASYYQKL